jgi:hypothetical protein
MTKFIRLKTTTGADLLLRTKWIFAVCGCPEKPFTRVTLCNAIDHDDAYDVVQTVDEIQAMIQGDSQAAQQQSKFDDGHFTL